MTDSHSQEVVIRLTVQDQRSGPDRDRTGRFQCLSTNVHFLPIVNVNFTKYLLECFARYWGKAAA